MSELNGYPFTSAPLMSAPPRYGTRRRFNQHTPCGNARACPQFPQKFVLLSRNTTPQLGHFPAYILYGRTGCGSLYSASLSFSLMIDATFVCIVVNGREQRPTVGASSARRCISRKKYCSVSVMLNILQILHIPDVCPSSNNSITSRYLSRRLFPFQFLNSVSHIYRTHAFCFYALG